MLNEFIGRCAGPKFLYKYMCIVYGKCMEPFLASSNRIVSVCVKIAELGHILRLLTLA